MRHRIAVALALGALVSFGFASPAMVAVGAGLLLFVWFTFPELRSERNG
jgi:hypothetical protein